MEITTVGKYYENMFEEEQKNLAQIEVDLAQHKSNYYKKSQESSDAYKRKDEKSNSDFLALKKEEDYHWDKFKRSESDKEKSEKRIRQLFEKLNNDEMIEICGSNTALSLFIEGIKKYHKVISIRDLSVEGRSSSEFNVEGSMGFSTGFLGIGGGGSGQLNGGGKSKASQNACYEVKYALDKEKKIMI